MESGKASEPTPDVPETPLQQYPIQLTAAFCVETSASRTDHPPGEPPAGGVDGDIALTPLLEGDRAIAARMTVTYIAPAPADTVVTCRVVVQGDFRSEAPISEEHYQAFIAYTPIALLWPYARGYISDLARMLGVILPPLPTLHGLPTFQRSEEAPPEASVPQEA